MYPYYYETRIMEDVNLVLQNLPFVIGDKVEIILLKRNNNNNNSNNDYSLRGTNFKYINPTEPVAENDWEVTQ